MYHLSGVHRVGIENVEGIIRALAKLDISGTDSQSVNGASAASPDGLRVRPTGDTDFLRLAVLPFEDLSPSHDNEWFADGMMDELIGTLGSLSKLIVPGRSSVMVYKKDRPKASVIGRRTRSPLHRRRHGPKSGREDSHLRFADRCKDEHAALE